MQATISGVLEREHQSLSRFFGPAIPGSWLERFSATLEKHGKDEIGYWQSLGLEPHFLPPVAFDRGHPGWRHPTNPDFPRAVAGGGILIKREPGKFQVDPQALLLGGVTVLVDVRLKPDVAGGLQAYADDSLLGPVITSLRRERLIRHFPQAEDSRFGVSPEEWETHILPMLAAKLDVPIASVRLERVIEGNVIPQLFPDLPRSRDAETDTWVWYEEFFSSNRKQVRGRICGLASVLGGYNHITSASNRSGASFIAFRPIVVLG